MVAAGGHGLGSRDHKTGHDRMGLLIDGVWHKGWIDTEKTGGSFIRSESQFRNWITPDGAPGPTGRGGFAAESGRYHLYVSLACPWAHRALIFRCLKGLTDQIGVSVVHPDMLDDGWTFRTADPIYSGRVTVPILWDRAQDTIVSNESADIIRMFNSAFDPITGNTDDFWPETLRAAIAPVNDRIYDSVNNGVYKAGFATTQAAYDAAVIPLFESLDWLEERLSSQRYLMGDRITEADWRLFTTLIRFDPVYHLHFKCNRRRIVDYPALWAYTRELYQWPGVAETVNFDHIVRHYHYSHDSINPHRIIPINPVLDYRAPNARDTLGAA